jgi:tetratricopeptide (TPR) repeat protein
MKGFLITFTLSTVLMLGLVYAVVLNPSLFTNLFGSESQTEIQEEQTDSTTETIDNELPSSYQSQLDKGATLFEEGHYELAAAEYQKAATLAPQESEGYARLGKAYFYDEKYLEAKAALQKAITLGSAESEAQILLGRTYLELGKFSDAESTFLKITPSTTETVYYQAIFKAYNGAYEEAKTLFQQVIDSGESSELSQNATTYLSAMTEFGSAEDAPASYATTLIARSLAETGQETLAIDLVYSVLQVEPDYRDAWIILGYVYLSQEKYADAEEALLKAIELDPTKAETRYFLGLSYFGKEDYTSALIQFELALESGFEPRVQVYQKLGDAAVLVNDYQKAVEAYENVLILNSSDVNLYIRPIWIYLDQLNDLKSARTWAEKAVTDHPNSAMSYNLLGWVQTEAGEWTAAEENLNYALILDPNLAGAYLNFGKWYEAQGRLEEAKERYKRAYSLDAGGSIGNLAGERYNELIKQEEARAVETNPTNE